jgi:hypothetical protein
VSIFRLPAAVQAACGGSRDVRTANARSCAGTGQLSPDVLRAALERYGCDASDAAIDKMIRYIDVDGDGQVSLQEFAAVHAATPGGAASSVTK